MSNATTMFWLMSAPGEKGMTNEHAAKQAAFDKGKNTCAGYGSGCSKMDFPNLKVGTLDSLMLMSDELDKFDKHADIALRRIVRAWCQDVSTEEEDTNANQLKVPDFGDVGALEGMTRFHWCEERFQHKDPLPDLAAKIHKQIVDMDDEVKANLGAYAQIKNLINAQKRKSGGNLLVRDLNGIVKQSCYAMHTNGDISEKILPIFLVVPKQRLDDFQKMYESASKECVPKSWRPIEEDDSYVLGRVLHLECPSLQSFKNKMSENKFTIREFTYDSSAVEENKVSFEKLQEEEKEALTNAKNTLHMAFGEVFVCHMHLKAVRMFVESVLWYGIPVNFQAMVVSVNMRKEAGLDKALDETFKDAKGSGGSTADKDDDEHPFVKFPFDLEFMSQ